MYPDLSYLFHDLFNTDVDNWTSIFKSFGLCLGMAFLACGFLVKAELKRIEAIGLVKPFQVIQKTSAYTLTDLAINTAIVTFMAAKLPYIMANFDAFKGDPASIIFSKLGNWPIGLLIGAVAGAYYYFNKYVKQGQATETTIMVHPHEKTTDIVFLAAISGVLGARLFSIFENLDNFFKDPLGVLFSGSGLTIYGGLIVAFIAVYWYVKKNGIKPIYMMDIAGMGILLGYAIGRIGCQVSGDGDWGIVAGEMPNWWFLPDWLWSYNYPHNVSNEGVPMAGCDLDKLANSVGYIEERCKEACGMRYCHELTPKVYPTPLWETILSLSGLLVLWLVRKKIKIAGMLFFMYLTFNGVERFFIETVRVNTKYNYFGVNWSQAQYISVCIMIIGIIGIFYLSRKKPGWEN